MINRKNVWITFIPALLMTAVVSAYLFVAPEMLALNETLSYVLSVVVMAVAGFFFVQYKNGLNAEGAKDKASTEAEIAAKGQ